MIRSHVLKAATRLRLTTTTPSGAPSTTRAVRTCGRHRAARWQASRRRARMDVGTDGVARFDRSGMVRLVAGAPLRRHVLTLSATDAGYARMCSPSVPEKDLKWRRPHRRLNEIAVSDPTTFEGLSQFAATT
jgi:hypothetical protein